MKKTESIYLTIAILTVSDRCSKGLTEDISGRVLKDLIVAAGWIASDYAVVPDECEDIEAKILGWCEKGVDVVLTSGGTGPGPRDVTAIVTGALLEKELPGIGELMRAEGLKKTPYAVLSGGKAGVRKKTLIINFPGSPKGVTESFETVKGLIPHAKRMIHGGGH